MRKRISASCKTIKYFIFLSVFLNLSFSNAQNFVSDSSFEHNSSIPILLSSIGLNGTWSSPTWGTTDLFCECNKKLAEKSEANVPSNPFGTQKANTGKCYAGFYAFSHADYREYLITQLSSPLNPGTKYELYMYLSLADFSRVNVHQLGVAFLSSKPTYTSSNVITNVKPVYFNINEDIGNDTTNWHQVVIEYQAKGGEQYLLIGSFDVYDIYYTNVKAPKNVRTKINQKTERDAYYYIDDVSLHEVPPDVEAKFDYTVTPIIDTLKPVVVYEPEVKDTATEPPIQQVVLNKAIVLKNVLFESGKAVLLQLSFLELDDVIKNLKADTLLNIEISGHTDNRGNEAQNKTLSEKRAKAVAEYFVSKKINASRINYKGLGSEMPIATNDNEEGRHLNRRVELKFYK